MSTIKFTYETFLLELLQILNFLQILQISCIDSFKNITWYKILLHKSLAVLSSFLYSYDVAELVDRLRESNGIFWIGLNDIERAGFYQWVDGSTVTFTNWDLGQPGW